MTTIDIEWVSEPAAIVSRGSGAVGLCNQAFKNMFGENVEALGSVWEFFGVDQFENGSKEVQVQHQHFKLSTRTGTCEDTLFLSFVDMTAVVQARERQKLFLELSLDGFWEWRVEEDTSYLSARFLEIHGYTEKEKELFPGAWMGTTHQDDIDVVEEAFRKHFDSGSNEVFSQEVRYIHKDGSIITISCRGRVVEWDAISGKPLRMVGMHTDITDAKKKEAEAKVSAKHKVDLDEERRMTEYLAHEVRNPLLVALSATRFISENVALHATWKNKQKMLQTREDTELLENNLSFVSDMVGNMLDLNRLISGNMHLNREFTNFRQTIAGPATSLISRSTAFKIEIECPDDLTVELDAFRVKQVLVNIVQNAARFVKTGFIRIRAMQTVDGIEISVEDSGPGIEDNVSRNLFEKYTGGLQRDETSGARIGMSLCKLLIETMGGTIFHDRSYNSGIENLPGTRIAIRLPAMVKRIPTTEGSEVSSLASEPEIGLNASRFKESRCLLVDDDVTVRKMLTRRFERLLPPCSVIDVAESGESALEMAKRHNYDLFVVDHYMPGPDKPLTGEETIRLLRKGGANGIIIGCSGNDVSEKHVKAGADLFVCKPLPGKRKLCEMLNKCANDGRIGKRRGFEKAGRPECMISL
uniref:Histidine kinase n=1 Tax=Mucochytrium quahogii TaxID=96639 RepID=A0A7S2RUZ1_9STRA|mmetsp:Transcript_12498/g.20221  ORF Transcript_12498/g.20221 Transcript_12498/m.20221 type:complete len:641 (+) Transcript_12498:285-2207(+)|eukprot:CAMPEP_0203765026 /NCGR_PEP_ID=MMETSP0098-20131031/18169_1 /ASSEMBLY_ACC=CAM_ASM_000208 /TAXON_ID=96639 /ORGANISM=" , Strain NY0313808BC1" /LENGTH=640 /DNA_ID=CAMNT_0050661241 /DNA_START=670 /DNA_END=2592 /DNA_ORIENTATION=+